MLLKNSISKAKRLFNNTLKSFKELLSGGYQKLPKTPPFNPFSCSDLKTHHSFRELDSFYDDFTSRWGIDQDKRNTKKKKMTGKTKEPMNDKRMGNKQEMYNGSFLKFGRGFSLHKREHQDSEEEKRKRVIAEEKRIVEEEKIKRRIEEEKGREEACCNVALRLKEIELMDASNVDHVLDIEEVLHYYSRITCPLYIDIFNKFFTEMCAEFIPQTSHFKHHRNLSGW